MRIKLSPLGSGEKLTVVREDDILIVNGRSFDFSRVGNGDTLPFDAVACDWLIGPVERISGELQIHLLMPHDDEAAEAVRFPADVIDPPNGPVRLPSGESESSVVIGLGVIDWSRLVTAEDKARDARELLLSQLTSEIAQRRAAADNAIAPLQDAIDLEEATAEEADRLKAWKRYRIALSRVPEQAGYPNEIDWPSLPA
ncbi:tail fiber assembly protein [Pseudomonas laurentiana]